VTYGAGWSAVVLLPDAKLIRLRSGATSLENVGHVGAAQLRLRRCSREDRRRAGASYIIGPAPQPDGSECRPMDRVQAGHGTPASPTPLPARDPSPTPRSRTGCGRKPRSARLQQNWRRPSLALVRPATSAGSDRNLRLALAVAANQQARAAQSAPRIRLRRLALGVRMVRRASFGEIVDRAGQGCASGASARSPFVRGAEPGVQPSVIGEVRRGVREGAVQGELSRSIRRDPRACDLILPDRHSLESWGDDEAGHKAPSLFQQPALIPVYSPTRARADVLIEHGQKDIPPTAAG